MRHGPVELQRLTVKFNPDGSLKLPGSVIRAKEGNSLRMRNQKCITILRDVVNFSAPKKCTLHIKLSDAINDSRFIENVYNYLEARNNDGSNKLNEATYSTELVIKLLNIYGVENGLIYDPFIGIGTTAKGALEFGMNYVGSEISKEFFFINSGEAEKRECFDRFK